MIFRSLAEHQVSALCFGTATFASGRLSPGQDSEQGMEALRTAMKSGVNLVHSNPRSGTMWAVRKALQQTTYGGPMPSYLVKIEVPMGLPAADTRRMFRSGLDDSFEQLGVSAVLGVTYEIDIRRTGDQGLAHDRAKVLEHLNAVREGFDKAKEEKRAELLLFRAHDPPEMRTSLDSGLFDAMSAYFSLLMTWPAQFFDEMSDRGIGFIGMRPLGGGRLTSAGITRLNDRRLAGRLKGLKVKYAKHSSIQRLAIDFSLCHGAVVTTVVGMSNPTQVKDLVSFCEDSRSVDLKPIFNSIEDYVRA